MKTKHNKKRNTAFIFESLIHEMTKAVVSKDVKNKNVVAQIFKEHFQRGSTLEKELQCYQALMQEAQLDQSTAERTIQLAKSEHSKINKKALFQEQSQVIRKINTSLGSHVFANFVPSYRTTATIAQIFAEKTSLSQKIIMEKQILEGLTADHCDPLGKITPVDNLVVKSFAENYNTKYNLLLPEQRNLLEKYIFAFGDNDVDFRIAIGSELQRIHEAVRNSLTLAEVASDEDMVGNTKKVLQEIEDFNVPTIGEKELKKILKLQALVNEYNRDAS